VNVTIFLQHSVDAITVGGLYALAALGIGLIFGIMRLINFAHGEFIMVGGYTFLLLLNQSALVMLLGMSAVVILLAVVTERIAFRPVRSADPATMLVTSFAVSFFLQHLFVMLFGARPKGIDIMPVLMKHFMFLGLRIPKLHLVTIVVTLILLGGLALFLKRTDFGIQMRAAAEDFKTARLLGVRANLVISVAFALSGLLAAAVSILFVAQTGTLTPRMGVQLILIAFVSTITGGMGSLVGAVIGGFFVGALTVALQALLPAEIRPFWQAFVFAIIIIVLLLRPQGLFKVHAVQERI
jgi:branched-chain amino acid transport system permease protein